MSLRKHLCSTISIERNPIIKSDYKIEKFSIQHAIKLNAGKINDLEKENHLLRVEIDKFKKTFRKLNKLRKLDSLIQKSKE
jgi:5'(3')-deoxyribonucleotidase